MRESCCATTPRDPPRCGDLPRRADSDFSFRTGRSLGIPQLGCRARCRRSADSPSGVCSRRRQVSRAAGLPTMRSLMEYRMRMIGVLRVPVSGFCCWILIAYECLPKALKSFCQSSLDRHSDMRRYPSTGKLVSLFLYSVLYFYTNCAHFLGLSR